MEFPSNQTDFLAMTKSKLEALLPPEMNPTRVGARVTAMREVLRLAKGKFADSIGLDRSALTRIEKGDEGLGIAKAVIISDIYGFGLNYLYRGDLSDTPLQLRSSLLNELHTLRALPAQSPSSGP